MTQTSVLMLWAEDLEMADRGRKIANSKLWHIKSQLLFAKGKELTSTTSANVSVQFKTDYLGQTAHLEHFCMVRKK